MDVMTTPRSSEQQRRTLALAMLRELLPTLYDIARNEVEYREAAGDLMPGALTTNDVVDGVVPTAYRQLVTDPDQHALASGLRRLAVDHINRELARVKVNGAHAEVLYFFEPGEEREAGIPIPDEPVAAVSPAPAAEAPGDDLRQWLERTLTAMPSIWRRALLLRHVDGLTCRAVARAVGRPEREIGAMLDHARAYLRDHLLSSRYASPDPGS